MLNLFVSALLMVLTASGCGPKYTYPADTVAQSIEDVCRKEYTIDVMARAVGRTLGALYYVDDILDDQGQIPKEIHEKMGQIMQVVTRVGLSTDKAVDFCVVIIRDRQHQNELVITRSLEDTKRANSDAIGVEESINRTLFGQGKYNPAGGEASFVLKEVTLEDFLAEQVAQRIRFGFARDSKEDAEAQQSFVLVDGAFNPDPERKFRFSVLSLKAEEPHEVLLAVLRTVSEVLSGYRYTEFTAVEVLDYLNRQKLEVTNQVLQDYRDKKITEQTILDRYVTESQTIQEAFKLFGFNLTDTVDAEPTPAIAAPTP